jgi:hypothetical protein
MIQFNLLPDVKIEYIKAQRTKRTVMGISVIASAAALVIFVFLLMTVHVFQKKNMSDLTKDIATSSKELRQTPNLSKMLTVQSQLNSLTGLHDEKPTTSRMFTFMNQLTPKEASISQFKLDLETKTVSISGDATSLDVVNKFVDSIKYTKYATADDTDTKQAFSNVVLTSFNRDEKQATYTIDFAVDTAIFNNASDVTLLVNGATASNTEAQ